MHGRTDVEVWPWTCRFIAHPDQVKDAKKLAGGGGGGWPWSLAGRTWLGLARCAAPDGRLPFCRFPSVSLMPDKPGPEPNSVPAQFGVHSVSFGGILLVKVPPNL